MKQYKDMNQLERWFRWQLNSIGDWFSSHGAKLFANEQSKFKWQMTRIGTWFRNHGIDAYDTIDWS